MPNRRVDTFGQLISLQFEEAVKAVKRAPLPCARLVPLLRGVNPKGDCIEPLENVLAKAIDIMVASRRLFILHGDLVLEVDDADGRGKRLVYLRTAGEVNRQAASLLANLFHCEIGDVQFPPPRRFVEVLLLSDVVNHRIPTIRTYASRPVFDRDFVLRQPGWHADVGILVHGPQIEPAQIEPATAGAAPINRLPRCLREVFRNFCFKTPADLANAVGALLTPLVIEHVIDTGKPIGVVDGNQPGIGKTLLSRCMAAVLDGCETDMIAYTPDNEEMEKRLCSTIRSRRSSILLIDNAKRPGGGEISSPAIEANACAPEFNFRILGTSRAFRGRNIMFWLITMNDAKLGPDLVSRCLPIQLNYEGSAEKRAFDGPEPFEFALGHRPELLAELYGIVLYWLQHGRPLGGQAHRFPHWAATIGGILATFGIDGFLENFAVVSTTLNSTLDQLSALAETAVADSRGPWLVPGQDSVRERSRLARDWEPLLKQAKVDLPALANARSKRARATLIGGYLRRFLGRSVPIEAGGRLGTACLRDVPLRSNQRGYYFEVTWSASDIPDCDLESPSLPADNVHYDPRPTRGRGDLVPRVQQSGAGITFPADSPDKQSTPSVPSSTNSGGNVENW